MWAARSEKLDMKRGLRFVVDLDSRPATFADVLKGWRVDETFCSVFTEILAGSPFTAFRFETPPVTDSTLNQDFEFVLLDSPYLARRPDLNAFAEYFQGAMDRGVVVVPNLGGDAILVVPCPIGNPSCYGHLGAFVRGAPGWQQHAFWHAVAEAMDRRIGRKPVWLSTAGGGVSWVHVRLDDRPKYYGFDPYRQAARRRSPAREPWS